MRSNSVARFLLAACSQRLLIPAPQADSAGGSSAGATGRGNHGGASGGGAGERQGGDASASSRKERSGRERPTSKRHYMKVWCRGRSLDIKILFLAHSGETLFLPKPQRYSVPAARSVFYTQTAVRSTQRFSGKRVPRAFRPLQTQSRTRNRSFFSRSGTKNNNANSTVTSAACAINCLPPAPMAGSLLPPPFLAPLACSRCQTCGTSVR